MNRYRNTPLINALKKYITGQRTIMHMPGHKQGKGFDPDFLSNAVRFDLTELNGLDNFHNPEGAILESMEALRKAYGAEKSYFLVNGSSSGIHAGILACFNRGDKILVNRNCHISVINALILFGVEPVFVMPGYIDEYNLAVPPGIDEWKTALEQNPDAKGALVTTPDYYGICQPLSDLSNFLHEKGKLLLVDEAHGAHFAFSDRLPETALEQGADLCVQSFHKTLPAFTQAAVLHIGSKRIDPGKVSRAVSMITTTSPSYTIMASMDYARDFAVSSGTEVYGQLIDILDDAKKKLSKMQKLRVIPDSIEGLKRDPTRLVIDTSSSDISGYELYDRIFSEYRITAEMCDTCHVVFIHTMADTAGDISKLTHALLETDSSIGKSNSRASFRIPFSTGRYSIPELKYYLASTEEIPLEKAEGFTCADAVTPYPPGIPVLCPGEAITAEHIRYLDKVKKYGADVHGLRKDRNGTGMIRVINTKT